MNLFEKLGSAAGRINYGRSAANIGVDVLNQANFIAKLAVPTAVAALNTGKNLALGAEVVARNALTWSPFDSLKGKTGINPYFPYFNNPKYSADVRRFAPNARIAHRIIGFSAAYGAVSAFAEVVAQKGPAPSVYHDGISVRHANDLGATAANMRPQEFAPGDFNTQRMIPHIF